jgi:hypothetical protein
VTADGQTDSCRIRGRVWLLFFALLVPADLVGYLIGRA